MLKKEGENLTFHDLNEEIQDINGENVPNVLDGKFKFEKSQLEFLSDKLGDGGKYRFIPLNKATLAKYGPFYDKKHPQFSLTVQSLIYLSKRHLHKALCNHYGLPQPIEREQSKGHIW